MRLWILFLFFTFGTNLLLAENVLRFRGENSQGKYEETGLLSIWPEEGLEPKWVAEELGAGWSSVIKVGSRLYLNSTDANDRKMESVICLDLDGNKLWQTTTGAAWTGSYPEARMTPTYVPRTKSRNARIVVLTGNGEVVCLAAATGKIVWKKNVAEIYGTRFGRWGMCESPIVRRGTIFLTVCGEKASVVALSVVDGSVVWEAEPVDGQGAYVTPILFENQLIAMTAERVFGVDIRDGKLLWQDDYQSRAGDHFGSGINCNTPLLRGNRFFVTGGYDQLGVMYEILPNAEGVKVVWTSEALDIHHGNAVEVEGRIYGSNWLNNSMGNWVCLDWETGETIYEKPWERLGKGAVIYADGRLYLYEEKRGTLGLAIPDDRLNVVSSFRVTFGTQQHWAHPVICDGILYVRHGTSLAAFDIRQEGKEKT